MTQIHLQAQGDKPKATAERPAANGRRIIFALIAITIAPVLASYLAYYVIRPQGGKSFGELLPVKPVPAFVMTTLDSTKRTGLSEFKGKWLLVMADGGDCNESCLASIYALRQFRLAQGKHMDRVERLWLVTDRSNVSAKTATQAEGMQIRRSIDGLPFPGDIQQSIYIVDPLGNQVMRYNRDTETGKVIKELGKLLKNNQSLG